MFWIGVCFEMPLVVMLLAKLKMVTAKQLLQRLAVCHCWHGIDCGHCDPDGRSDQYGPGHAAFIGIVCNQYYPGCVCRKRLIWIFLELAETN